LSLEYKRGAEQIVKANAYREDTCLDNQAQKMSKIVTVYFPSGQFTPELAENFLVELFDLLDAYFDPEMKEVHKNDLAEYLENESKYRGLHSFLVQKKYAADPASFKELAERYGYLANGTGWNRSLISVDFIFNDYSNIEKLMERIAALVHGGLLINTKMEGMGND
jgi:hypothetical protein